MPDWPTGLPFFRSLDTQRRVGADHLIRSAMSQGPDKVRRRSTLTIPIITGETKPMTTVQANSFRSFFDATLAGGALSFTHADPFTGAEKRFRFVDGYTESRKGKGLAFSATLEVLP